MISRSRQDSGISVRETSAGSGGSGTARRPPQPVSASSPSLRGSPSPPGRPLASLPQKLATERGQTFTQTSKTPTSSRTPISQCYRNTLPRSGVHPNVSKLPAIDDRSVLSDVLSKSGFGDLTHIVDTIVKRFLEQLVEEIQVKLGVLSDDVGTREEVFQEELDSELFQINEELVKELEEQLKIAQQGESETAQERDRALKSAKVAWKQVEKAEEERKKAEEERKKVEEKRDQALENITEWKEQCQNLESRNKKIGKQLEDAEGRHLTALCDANNLRRENTELQEEVSAFPKEKDSLQKENKAIQEQCSRMEQQITQLKMQVDNLHEKGRDRTEGLVEDIARLEERVAGLEEENSSRQDRIKSVEGEKSELQAGNDKLQGERDGLQGERDELHEERDKLQGERDELHEERDKLQGERDELHEERDKLQGERDELHEEKDRLQGERDGFLEQINALEGQKDALFVADQTTQEEQHTLQREKDTLQRERETLQREITRLGLLSLAADGRAGVRKNRAHGGQVRPGRVMMVRSLRDRRTVQLTRRADQGFPTGRTSVSRETQQLHPIHSYLLSTLE